jgi:hypothetical protein
MPYSAGLRTSRMLASDSDHEFELSDSSAAESAGKDRAPVSHGER